MPITDKKRPLRIGIITPTMSGPLKRFIDYSLRYLPMHLANPIETTYFARPITDGDFPAFAQDVARGNFDLLWGMTLIPTIQLQRLRVEHNITVPMLACTSMTVEQDQPLADFNVLTHPDMSQPTADFFANYYAPLQKIIIAGRSNLLTASQPIINLKKALESAGTQVAYLATDIEAAPYDTFMRGAGKDAQLMYITPDAVALNLVEELALAGHTHHCPVFCSEFSAFKYHIDGVIGFAVEVIAQETAQAIAHTILGTKSFSAPFSSPQRICLPITPTLKTDRLAAVTQALPSSHYVVLIDPVKAAGIANDITVTK